MKLYELPETLSKDDFYSTVPLPVTTLAQLLPFGLLTWENFERLCLHVAKDVDNYEEARLYGERGQDQDGIDLFASSPGRSSSVYQVRNIVKLTASKLKKAVSEYFDNPDRIEAKRFVLCVACSGRNSRVLTQLRTTQREYEVMGLEVELYDQETLSQELRSHPRIVSIFFSEEWRQAFCLPTDGMALDREALLLGPIRALGLEGLASEADSVRELDAEKAALIYGDIARQLQRKYPLQSSTFNQLRASALAKAGLWNDSFDLWFQMALDAIWNEAQPRLPPGASTGFSECKPNVDEIRLAKLGTLEAWQAWHEDSRAVSLLTTHFLLLHAHKDPFALQAGVLLAEAIATDRTQGAMADVRDTLFELSSLLDNPERIRIRAALADSDGPEHWQILFRKASRREHRLAYCAYLCLRAGRAFSWFGDFENAENAYRRAVELSAEARLDLDAKHALEGLTAVYSNDQSDRFREAFASNQMALTIDGVASFVAQNKHTWQNALSAKARSQQLGDAHMWLRHSLWESVVGGSLLGELESLENLGQLYASTDNPLQALHAYIRAGRSDEAAVCAASLSVWVDVTAHLVAPTPWQREACLCALAAEGDLIPESVAQVLVEPIVQGLEGKSRSVMVAAAKLAAALVFQFDLASTTKILNAFMPLARRPFNTHRVADDSMFRFFLRAFNRYSELREEIAEGFDACAYSESYSPTLYNTIINCAESKPIRDRLERRADKGEPLAITLLAGLESDNASVTASQMKKLENILKIDTVTPKNTFSFGGEDFSLTNVCIASLVSEVRLEYVLKLLDIASSNVDMLPNRMSALQALIKISLNWKDEFPREVFERTFNLTSEVAVSEVDEMSLSSRNPLSRWHLNFGTPDQLRGLAVWTCSFLVDAEPDRSQVLKCAFGLMSRQIATDYVSKAIIQLHIKGERIDPTWLVLAPDSHIRAAAATIWAGDPNPSDLGESLIEDKDVSVRVALAQGLTTLATKAATIASDLRQRLLIDSSAVVREVAKRSAAEV